MKININLASATGENYQEQADFVELKLIDGNVTILPNHLSFISTIKNGYAKFNDKTVDIEKASVHFKDNKLYVAYFK